MSVSRFIAIAVVATFALAGTACSASESVVEKAAEEATGAKDVDYDEKTGEVKVTGKDGEEYQVGGTELPDGWPDDVPMPDGAKITSGNKFNTGDGDQYAVTATVDSSASDVLDFYKSALSGYKQESNMTTDDNSGLASYKNGTSEVSIAVAPTDGKTGVTVSVVPVTS